MGKSQEWDVGVCNVYEVMIRILRMRAKGLLWLFSMRRERFDCEMSCQTRASMDVFKALGTDVASACHVGILKGLASHEARGYQQVRGTAPRNVTSTSTRLLQRSLFTHSLQRVQSTP